MIDLEEIQSRLDQGVASLTDAHDLLREVERLRDHAALPARPPHGVRLRNGQDSMRK